MLSEYSLAPIWPVGLCPHRACQTSRVAVPRVQSEFVHRERGCTSMYNIKTLTARWLFDRVRPRHLTLRALRPVRIGSQESLRCRKICFQKLRRFRTCGPTPLRSDEIGTCTGILAFAFGSPWRASRVIPKLFFILYRLRLAPLTCHRRGGGVAAGADAF